MEKVMSFRSDKKNKTNSTGFTTIVPYVLRIQFTFTDSSSTGWCWNWWEAPYPVWHHHLSAKNQSYLTKAWCGCLSCPHLHLSLCPLRKTMDGWIRSAHLVYVIPLTSFDTTEASLTINPSSVDIRPESFPLRWNFTATQQYIQFPKVTRHRRRRHSASASSRDSVLAGSLSEAADPLDPDRARTVSRFSRKLCGIFWCGKRTLWDWRLSCHGWGWWRCKWGTLAFHRQDRRVWCSWGCEEGASWRQRGEEQEPATWPAWAPCRSNVSGPCGSLSPVEE